MFCFKILWPSQCSKHFDFYYRKQFLPTLIHRKKPKFLDFVFFFYWALEGASEPFSKKKRKAKLKPESDSNQWGFKGRSLIVSEHLSGSISISNFLQLLMWAIEQNRSPQWNFFKLEFHLSWTLLQKTPSIELFRGEEFVWKYSPYVYRTKKRESLKCWSQHC